MLPISKTVAIPDSEIEWTAARSQGPGGQNVNKVATAVHLRFDVRASSLPDVYKEKLLALHDQRLTKDGAIVIKAQRTRSQEKNLEDALARLQTLIRAAVAPRKARRATKPSKAAKQKRIESKTKRGQVKALRGKIENE